MPGPDPYDLPTGVVDAVTSRLVGAASDERAVVLAALLGEYPAHANALRTLANDLASAEAVLDQAFAPAPETPRQIGGYRVVRKLGEGAFGVVYLCEQAEPIRREVAVKLLRPGTGDRATLARFDSERRFLARLHHPAIAQIFDAGLLADGRPWFVMEPVLGVPITDYCDRVHLSIAARLVLFARLCQGAQHAHEQGIVHRDLKPANILVVEIDGEARPKIIDFGIAKALQSPTERPNLRTETGRVVGTPGYMSPEQAAARLSEVDARSDLFSLGVVLYELLTGDLPWGRRPTSTDNDPPRPSSRISGDKQQQTTVAARRASQPRKLASQLRGDLDWIVLKALSRERARRYASALDLASDIHRHLRGETVHAGPPSLGHRLRKFARRHRSKLSTLAAVSTLVAFGIWLLGGYRTEARVRGSEAEAAAKTLLASANARDVIEAPGSEPVRQTLARDALALYDQFLRERPDSASSREGRARTLWTLSQVHWLIGEYARSEVVAREAVAAGDELLASEPDRVTYRCILANAQRIVGRAVFSQGRCAEGRLWFQRAVDGFELAYAQNREVAAPLLVMALLELRSAIDEADVTNAILAHARTIQRDVVRTKPDSMDERDTLVRIELLRGEAAAARGDFATAHEVLADAEAARASGSLHVNTQVSLLTMAAELSSREGNHAASLARLEQALVSCRNLVASEPNKANPHNLLTATLGALIEEAIVAGDDARLTRGRQEAVEAAEKWTERFPEDPGAARCYCASVHLLNLERLFSGRRRDLAGAERIARKACAQLARLRPDDTVAQRSHLSWMTLGGLGLVADALGLADADAVWQSTAAAMAAWRANTALGDRTVAEYLMYGVRIVRRHLAAERDDAAAKLLADLDDVIARHPQAENVVYHAPDVWRLHALLAVHRADWDAAADAAEEACAANDGWRGAQSAADAYDRIWRAARRANAGAAASCRDRTIELCTRTIDGLEAELRLHPADPWLRVPCEKARVRLALAQRDRGDEVDVAQLRRSLDELAEWRDELHASEWDQELCDAGAVLLGK
jgi:serine/threonine protein kinase/tetratricopeptide (TPR) repeat protein